MIIIKYTPAPPAPPIYVEPPPKIVVEEEIIEEGIACPRCGLYHADMCNVTMANLKDVDLEGLNEIKRRTDIVYEGDATFERHGRKDTYWSPNRPRSNYERTTATHYNHHHRPYSGHH